MHVNGMRYRRAGSSDLVLSEIGFGTGDNAGLMIAGTEREQLRTVERALELGITYFDTAPYYGAGQAERNLGRVLKALRAEPVICTKAEILPEQLTDIGTSVTTSLVASLRRLERDFVDILMIHNPPRAARNPAERPWAPLTPADVLGSALEALERARTAGKVRFFGISCDGAEEQAVRMVLASGRFAIVNANHNLVRPDKEFVAIAQAYGAGVAVIRPLAGGALTSQVLELGTAGRHAVAGGTGAHVPRHFAEDTKRGQAFGFLATESRTLAQAAYQFALRHPGVTTVLGGYSDRTQLEELAVASDAPPLSGDDIERIEYGLAE